MGACESTTLGISSNIYYNKDQVGAGAGSDLGTNTSQDQKAQGGVDMGTNLFVDFETLGLIRSSRSNKGKAPKSLINIMMTLYFAAFVNPITLSTETLLIATKLVWWNT